MTPYGSPFRGSVVRLLAALCVWTPIQAQTAQAQTVLAQTAEAQTAQARTAQTRTTQAQTGQPLRAVVPTRIVHPGQLITAADLRLVTVRNPNPVARPVVRDIAFALGKVSKRTLLPRRYIARTSLRLPHAVEAGKRVELRYRRGAVLITVPGTALGSAVLGQAVSVRVHGGRTVLGTVAAPGLVKVSP